MSQDLPSITHRVQSIEDWLQQEDEELLYTPDLRYNVEFPPRGIITGSFPLPTSDLPPEDLDTLTIPDNIPVWIYNPNSILDIWALGYRSHTHAHRTHFFKLRCLYSFGAIFIYINNSCMASSFTHTV